jgi:hypothetical protein
MRRKMIFCWRLEGHLRKEQDPEPAPEPLAGGTIRGSGFVPKWSDPEHCSLYAHVHAYMRTNTDHPCF